MASCERKPSGRLISSRPLWSDPRISVQSWQNLPSEDGTPIDPIRISFSVDGVSWFLPWGKFVALVNEGNVTVGRNLTGNRFGGNQLIVRYRQCHRLSVAPLTFCSGHDHEIVFGNVQVSEIIERVNDAREEWARLFGGEYGGLSLPRLASQVLITEALRARGALGSSLPDETAQRDEFFDACGGPDQEPKPVEIEPSDGKKQSYDDDDEPGDGDASVGNPAPSTGERGAGKPSEGSTDNNADESAARLRRQLIERGLIKPRAEEPTVAQQTDTPDDAS